MIKEKDLKRLVDFFNRKLEERLGDKLESIYIVGSYARGKVSLSRPDINWLLIWKNFIAGEELWQLGKVIAAAIDVFEPEFTVRPEFRPFKFSYPLDIDKDEVFINVAFAFAAGSADEFKKRNSFIPEYVFDGFKESRKLVFGSDVLAGIKFVVSRQLILDSAKEKILSHHKIQLDRVPLVYHSERQSYLIFNEALSHGKNLRVIVNN